MPGSSASISGVNVVLNTAVAESLRQYADILEQADDLTTAVHDLIQRVIKEHKRVIFNGNGYDGAWIEEAHRRGLLDLRTTPDCVPYYLDKKNIALFSRHGVYSEVEMRARYEIKLDSYRKVLRVEALTMLDMVRKEILPAVSRYTKELAESVSEKRNIEPQIDTRFEVHTLRRLCSLTGSAAVLTDDLQDALDRCPAGDALQQACYYRNQVLSLMEELRVSVDEMELLCAEDRWPVPSYGDLLFSVN